MRVEPETLGRRSKAEAGKDGSAASRADGPPGSSSAAARPADTAAHKPASGAEEGSLFATAVRNVVGTVVNASNFAMGFGWYAFANVVAASSFPGDPEAASAWKRWLVAMGIVAVLVPTMALLIRWRTRLEERGKRASQAGDPELAHRLKVQANSVGTLVSWGCAFCLAGQLDGAAMASLPRSPWGWRLLYVLLLAVAVSLLSLVVTVAGRRCAGEGGLQDHVADAIISGSAYAVAMAFLGTVTSASASTRSACSRARKTQATWRSSRSQRPRWQQQSSPSLPAWTGWRCARHLPGSRTARSLAARGWASRRPCCSSG